METAFGLELWSEPEIKLWSDEIIINTKIDIFIIIVIVITIIIVIVIIAVMKAWIELELESRILSKILTF